jgi:hypothetical protein
LPISDDVDPDHIISRLSGPLEPAARVAFRRAAEEALARVPCQGEGAAYRAVSVLQRNFFTPPDDYRAGWDIGNDISSRRSKLREAPAIEHVRYRRQER